MIRKTNAILIFGILPIVLLVFNTLVCPAFAYEAEVIGISDGDTITVLHDQKPVKIRLYGIDCPESNQAFGARAKQHTSGAAYGKIAEVKPTGTDRYGRTIAWVSVEGKSLNESLIAAGLAWHYKKYSSDHNLADLEAKAKKEKVGLWSDPHAIPPWDFRKTKRKQKK